MVVELHKYWVLRSVFAAFDENKKWLTFEDAATAATRAKNLRPNPVPGWNPSQLIGHDITNALNFVRTRLKPSLPKLKNGLLGLRQLVPVP